MSYPASHSWKEAETVLSVWSCNSRSREQSVNEGRRAVVCVCVCVCVCVSIGRLPETKGGAEAKVGSLLVNYYIATVPLIMCISLENV